MENATGIQCSFSNIGHHAGPAAPVATFAKIAHTPHTDVYVMRISAREKTLGRWVVGGWGVYNLASDTGKPEGRVRSGAHELIFREVKMCIESSV